MTPLCCGMRSHPYLSLLFLSQCRSSFLYLSILPAGCLSSLLYPNFYLDLVGPASIVPWERCIYELANCSDSGRASASMNAVSRERFTPAAAADAVILTSLRAPAPSILWLAAPLTRKEYIVYRVSSMRAVRRRVWRLLAICAGVNASSPISPPSRTLGNRNPDPLRVTIAQFPPLVCTRPWP